MDRGRQYNDFVFRPAILEQRGETVRDAYVTARIRLDSFSGSMAVATERYRPYALADLPRRYVSFSRTRAKKEFTSRLPRLTRREPRLARSHPGCITTEPRNRVGTAPVPRCDRFRRRVIAASGECDPVSRRTQMPTEARPTRLLVSTADPPPTGPASFAT